MKQSKEIYMYALGALIVFGFIGLLGILIFQGIPEVNKDILNITVGALIGSFTSIVGYFFGSSKGSADKTEILKNNTPRPAAPERVGCTDPKAMNYDPLATKDDGTCVYLAEP